MAIDLSRDRTILYTNHTKLGQITGTDPWDMPGTIIESYSQPLLQSAEKYIVSVTKFKCPM